MNVADKKARHGHRHSQIDDVDLRLAAGELDVGRRALADAHAMTDRRERAEAIKTAVGRLALASRTIDEVVDRRGGICGDVTVKEK